MCHRQQADDESVLALREVQAMAWAKRDAHLRHLASDRLPATQIPRLSQTQPRDDAQLRFDVFEFIKPSLEFLCLTHSEHDRNVSEWILTSSDDFVTSRGHADGKSAGLPTQRGLKRIDHRSRGATAGATQNSRSAGGLSPLTELPGRKHGGSPPTDISLHLNHGPWVEVALVSTPQSHRPKRKAAGAINAPAAEEVAAVWGEGGRCRDPEKNVRTRKLAACRTRSRLRFDTFVCIQSLPSGPSPQPSTRGRGSCLNVLSSSLVR